MTRVVLVLLLLIMAVPAWAQETVTVNWNDQHQVIDGFGAFWGWRCSWDPNAYSDAAMDLLFSPTVGIGASLVRTRIQDETTSPFACMLANLQTFMARVHQRNPAVPVWATTWTIPSQWTVNNVLVSGHFQDYANWLTTYSQTATSLGINLVGISLCNEPDFGPSGILASDMPTFVKSFLGPTFAANGVTTPIMLPETSEWGFIGNYATNVLNDAVAQPFVSIITSHDYAFQGYPPYTLAKTTGKKLWETEVSHFSTVPFDPSINDGLAWAQNIHTALTNAEVNAWHYWEYTQDQTSNENDNAGLIAGGIAGASPSPPFVLQDTKRVYAMGNFSKFIRPGWIRIGATFTSGVLASAYKNPATNDFAIVIINSSGLSPTVSVTLNGINGFSTTIAAWLTSPTSNLANTNVFSGFGNNFAATVPPTSITTFAARASASVGIPPTAPTNLRVS